MDTLISFMLPFYMVHIYLNFQLYHIHVYNYDLSIKNISKTIVNKMQEAWLDCPMHLVCLSCPPHSLEPPYLSIFGRSFGLPESNTFLKIQFTNLPVASAGPGSFYRKRLRSPHLAAQPGGIWLPRTFPGNRCLPLGLLHGAVGGGGGHRATLGACAGIGGPHLKAG